MITITIDGVHGGGKTTLVNHLKREYEAIGKSVHMIEESARICPHVLGTIQAQRWIWYDHWASEMQARESGADILLFDRSVMGNLVYFRYILDHIVSGYGEESFAFFHSVAKVHMLKYDYVIHLPLNEERIANDVDDVLRPRNIEYARKIDELFDEMFDPYVNATIDDLPFAKKFISTCV